jgi:hypothetical protein
MKSRARLTWRETGAKVWCSIKQEHFMKTKNFTRPALATIAALALLCGNVVAQNSTATTAPPLAYGVTSILQLAQAKVGDDVIISYIRNSGSSYGLNADQIIYLRQQGVSDNVINVMLNQPKVASTPAPTPAQAEVSTAYAQPTTTYVQTAPASSVYVIPNRQLYYYDNYYAQPYYYPYYGWPSPAVSLSFGSGGGFRGGGFHGGGFRGGGWHH